MHKMFRSALFGASAAVAAAVGLATPAAACNDEPYIGTICTFAFDWCPRNYIPADGRTLNVREYQALFALLGFRYGGDNANTFAVPDLRGRSVIGSGTGPGLQSIPIGAKVGQQQLTLQPAQVPLVPHTHTATFTGTGGGGSGPLVAGGTVTLPLTGSVANAPITGSVGGQTVGGTITVNALSTASGSASSVPVAGSKNTVGRATGGASGFYASSTATDVAVPTTFALTTPGTSVTGTATGGTLSGNATGNVSLPVTGATGITGGSVAVAPALAPATQMVSTQSPGIGQTVCIAANGLYPSRP